MSWFGGVLAISLLVTACWVRSPPPFGDVPPGPSCPSGSNAGALALDLELTPVGFAWFPDGRDPNDFIDVATGGSAVMTVLAPDGSPLVDPYLASSEDPSIVAVGSQSGSAVTLQAEVGGDACIDIADRESGDELGSWITASPLSSAAVFPGGQPRELIDDELHAFAFAAGDLQIGVGYVGTSSDGAPRLIDLGATLELAGATQTDWETIAFPSAAIGSYTIAMSVGDAAAGASFDVVDPATGAYAVVPYDVDVPGLSCFAAVTQASAFIVGMTWSFTLDDVTATASADYTNCIAIPDDGDVHTITASAGGQSKVWSAIAGI
jgi:hypothetical protein